MRTCTRVWTSLNISKLSLFKLVLWLVLAAPLIWLLSQIYIEFMMPTTALGADPGEAIVHFLGIWSLRWLLLAFAVSPVAKFADFSLLLKSRRLIGLWAFVYVLLHGLAYAFFFVEFEWSALLADFTERTYITAGLVAFVALLLMALTSTRGWQRRLRRNWQRLHRLMYPTVALAVIHFWWLTRDQYGEVLLYALLFALLGVLRTNVVAGRLRAKNHQN